MHCNCWQTPLKNRELQRVTRPTPHRELGRFANARNREEAGGGESSLRPRALPEASAPLPAGPLRLPPGRTGEGPGGHLSPLPPVQAPPTASPAPRDASGFLPSSIVAGGGRPPSPAGLRTAVRRRRLPPAFRRPALPRRAAKALLRLRPPARHWPGRCHGNVVRPAHPPSGGACAVVAAAQREGAGRGKGGGGAFAARRLPPGNRQSTLLTKKK